MRTVTRTTTRVVTLVLMIALAVGSTAGSALAADEAAHTRRPEQVRAGEFGGGDLGPVKDSRLAQPFGYVLDAAEEGRYGRPLDEPRVAGRATAPLPADPTAVRLSAGDDEPTVILTNPYDVDLVDQDRLETLDSHGIDGDLYEHLATDFVDEVDAAMDRALERMQMFIDEAMERGDPGPTEDGYCGVDQDLQYCQYVSEDGTVTIYFHDGRVYEIDENGGRCIEGCGETTGETSSTGSSEDEEEDDKKWWQFWKKGDIFHENEGGLLFGTWPSEMGIGDEALGFAGSIDQITVVWADNNLVDGASTLLPAINAAR